MKKLTILLLVFVMAILVSCSSGGCEHSWKEATCSDPKTCTLCGKTEGTSIAHNWSEATCTTVKTCEDCGKTEGTVADHNWNAATCMSAKSCSVCKKTEGEPLGHTDGSTCLRCGENLSDWFVGEYTDEFDMPTGKKYIAIYGTDGEFSNSATSDSDLTAVLQIDGDNIGIMLWEYGRSLVKGVYDSTSYSITILDANGTRHNFTGTMTKGNTRVYFKSTDRAKIINILKQEGETMIYLKNSKYTVSTYLFALDTKGFSEAYQSAGLS